MVSVSGYLIGNPEANKTPLPPPAELSWWYQFYFATERGRAGYDKYRHDFAKLIWHTASPQWNFDDETFDRSAASFDNPDHVDIVIHNYRWRLGLAPGEPQYDDLEQQLATSPVITVPTITLEGDANGAPHPDPSAYADEVHRQVHPPDDLRRRRAQPAPKKRLSSSSKPSSKSTGSRRDGQMPRALDRQTPCSSAWTVHDRPRRSGDSVLGDKQLDWKPRAAVVESQLLVTPPAMLSATGRVRCAWIDDFLAQLPRVARADAPTLIRWAMRGRWLFIAQPLKSEVAVSRARCRRSRKRRGATRSPMSAHRFRRRRRGVPIRGARARRWCPMGRRGSEPRPRSRPANPGCAR